MYFFCVCLFSKTIFLSIYFFFQIVSFCVISPIPVSCTNFCIKFIPISLILHCSLTVEIFLSSAECGKEERVDFWALGKARDNHARDGVYLHSTQSCVVLSLRA